ncbi:S1 RNA-binding domain-containing protein [Streptomyces sp. NPDC004539]|uniref:S1 RNA-binding domain-containing protein n=1 Tax=Streptomyces sp. NPDC004539 TaxID=3154280 RepID=UPI0033A6F962
MITASPELHAFLESLSPGQHLTGHIASIEPYGVFVALDTGPRHPVFPGVGFITHPDLSWYRFDSPTEVVTVGAPVTCVFLHHDTWNAEARLSLRALHPDPLHTFTTTVPLDRPLRSRVTKVVPIGVFVELTKGVEGLLRESGPAVGDEIDVVVTEIDPERRRVSVRRVGG